MVARRGDARRTLRHARQGWTRHGSMSLSPRARGTTRGTDRRGSGYRRRRRRRRRVAASVPRRAAAMHDDPPRRRRHPRRRTHSSRARRRRRGRHPNANGGGTRRASAVRGRGGRASMDTRSSRRKIRRRRVVPRGCASTLRDDTPSVVRRPRGVFQVHRRRRGGVRAGRTIAAFAGFAVARHVVDADASREGDARRRGVVSFGSARHGVGSFGGGARRDARGDAFDVRGDSGRRGTPRAGVSVASGENLIRGGRGVVEPRARRAPRRLGSHPQRDPRGVPSSIVARTGVGVSRRVARPARATRLARRTGRFEVSRRRVSRVFGRRRARQRRTRARAVEMRVRARPRGDDGVGRHAGKTPRDGRRRIARVDIRAISKLRRGNRAGARGRRRRREGGEKRPNQPRRRRRRAPRFRFHDIRAAGEVRTRARRRRSRTRRD